MEYPIADPEFLAMCRDRNFDRDRAEALLSSKIDANIPVREDYGSRIASWPDTYLYHAAQNNNIAMVELLLRHGADPNLCNKDEEGALWDLQYNDDADEPDADMTDDYVNGTVRLQIVQMLLAAGADPNIREDGDEAGETLYQYVRYKVFNELSEPDWEYVSLFFKLLVLYGGGDLPAKAPIDPARPEKYRFYILPADDSYHLRGEILDGLETVIDI